MTISGEGVYPTLPSLQVKIPFVHRLTKPRCNMCSPGVFTRTAGLLRKWLAASIGRASGRKARRQGVWVAALRPLGGALSGPGPSSATSFLGTLDKYLPSQGPSSYTWRRKHGSCPWKAHRVSAVWVPGQAGGTLCLWVSGLGPASSLRFGVQNGGSACLQLRSSDQKALLAS